ncbi:MAG: FlgO family outer membrane protein [Desulfobacteraceae bacterium]|nr:FlgO family outer membrane protein [Desulfobacteraceae bacterium]
MKTVAVLPFEIIAPEDLSYVQDGIVQMLHSRLVWKDKVSVIEQKKTEIQFNQIKEQNSDRRIESLAKSLGSDYIITGSITHFANAFSIDTRIYDIRNKQWMAFSEQSTAINDLIPKMSAISAKINKKVFDRETVIYTDLVRQEQEKAEQWKRQNPERLMPEMPAGEREKKSSLWRFWEYL